MPHLVTAESSFAKWPPREGRTFFLLWIGAAIAGWVASRALWGAISFSQGPGSGADQRWLTAIPAIAVGACHGWMLFSGGVRLVMWAALPALHAATPYFFKNPASPAFATAMGLVSIVTAIIGTILLTGVRRRQWLWLFVQLGALVLTQVVLALVFMVVGIQQFDHLAAQLNELFHLRGALSLAGGSLISSGLAALWLASTTLAAAALAWLMPPVGTVDASLPCVSVPAAP